MRYNEDMNIGFVSLGCCKNLVDTQNAMSFLKAMGHKFVSTPSEAECIIINTCGFINDAKEESINKILEMAEYKNSSCKYLIVMGCLVQRYKEDLIKELPEVDAFISIGEYDHLEEIFKQIFHTEIICKREVVLATNPYTAYLRIGDGCSNHCTYCAIPLIRGEFKSVPMEQVIDEAKELEKIGVKELNIIAQDTTKYGIDYYDELKLKDLLVELNKMNFTWIRVLYMYPDEISDELLDTMSTLDKVVPYFDIPIQHINNRLLSKMNRRGTKEDIIHVINKIKATFKNPILRTTIIVGFPSETEEEFNEVLDFINEYHFDRLGAFTYSLEEDTPAYDFRPLVDEKVAQNRLDRLMKKQNEISYQEAQKYVGEKLDVLIEKKDALKNIYIGRSKYHAPDEIDGSVRFTSNQDYQKGDIVTVEIVKANSYDLWGKIVDKTLK